MSDYRSLTIVREVVLSNAIGTLTFKCPAGIQRLDTANGTHGWQVRYSAVQFGTTFFADKSCGSPQESFHGALTELKARLKKSDPPIGDEWLQRKLQRTKGSASPIGVSGPNLKHTKGRSPEYSFGVFVPAFNAETGESSSSNTTVYIGTETTISTRRIAAAKKKAIEIRKTKIEAYRKAKRRFFQKMRREAIALVGSLIKELK